MCNELFNVSGPQFRDMTTEELEDYCSPGSLAWDIDWDGAQAAMAELEKRRSME